MILCAIASVPTAILIMLVASLLGAFIHLYICAKPTHDTTGDRPKLSKLYIEQYGTDVAIVTNTHVLATWKRGIDHTMESDYPYEIGGSE